MRSSPGFLISSPASKAANISSIPSRSIRSPSNRRWERCSSRLCGRMRTRCRITTCRILAAPYRIRIPMNMPPSLQDTMRLTNHLAVNLGVRWDLQTFTTKGLLSNPLFPPAGKVPFQPYNFAPRAGLAYSLGNRRPLVVRAGYGIFFVRIPQIYNSVIQTENGITNSHLFLNKNSYFDRQVFPTYPNPLVTCPLYAENCALPAGLTQGVTHEVSAFATNFVTPRVQQSSITFEKEIVSRTTVALSLLNVRGEHLIRALDVNLPQPVALTYPLFDSTVSIFSGGAYRVDSFSTWQFSRSL